jgi:hypothetical protein
LRCRITSATLGAVTRALLVLGVVLTVMATPLAAQGLPGGRRPDAIDEATGLATRPFAVPSAPARPAERYVPLRRVYSPAQGRDVLVPGHYERDVNGQRVEVPPLVTTTPDGQNATLVPGGERPPVGSRSAP